MTTPVRVVVVDDHPLFRIGLITVLNELSAIEVVGQAADGATALIVVAEQQPDVVLMDLRMPGMSGLTATAHIATNHSESSVVVLTMSEDDDSVFAALRAGARGYILKEADGDDVRRTVLAVARGEALFGPRIADRVVAFFAGALSHSPTIAAFPNLTDREREILALIAQGLDNAAVARRLVLSEKTVRNKVSDILAKLHTRSRAEAIVKAHDAGL